MSIKDQPTGVWLRDGSLLYRLGHTTHGLSNCDEINVTQVAISLQGPESRIAIHMSVADAALLAMCAHLQRSTSGESPAA